MLSIGIWSCSGAVIASDNPGGVLAVKVQAARLAAASLSLSVERGGGGGPDALLEQPAKNSPTAIASARKALVVAKLQFIVET